MNEKSAENSAWRRSAAPAVATTVLIGCTVASWSLFHREQTCWNKGGGRAMAAIAASGLGILGLLAVLASWALARWSESRGGAVVAVLLAAFAVLAGVGVVQLAEPFCD
ncbi:hypothetical protein [Streptomyces sp. NRRL WC-3742]|uniref:hypothetical protein n=1 Tax=Streptomyces sp. NRRL WC-3742 TaxID=1463934 RepID=UPI0004C83445|nr:hypothetical protein [Streptomyces sp. NRRL WC-3742]